MAGRTLTLGLVLASSLAHAQPVTNPADVPPLAQIRDEKQLAEALATITQDPAIRVDDQKNRPLAAALMTEGVRQLRAQAYEQALANFLEAYNKFPSPKILLNIGSTLRDMGRLADAANSYQRYLADPATGPERIAEVKGLLVKLDEQLTLLTIRVNPKGSDVSIDAGPFIPVGSTLQTRVRPGLHLVRVRSADAIGETTVNGFEGEQKDIELIAKAPPPTAPKPTEPPPPPPPKPAEPPPENASGWLITGTQYSTGDGTSRERKVRAGFAGPVVAAIVPKYEVDDSGEVRVEAPPTAHGISSGVVGIVRIDGKLRGVALGVGLAFVPIDRIELEIAGLKSDLWGAYVGARVRFLTGFFRPYVGGGIPMFFFKNDNDPDMSTHVAVGGRIAGGLELVINGHLSVQGDIGAEHFFNVRDVLIGGKKPDENVIVPTVGVIGRL